MRVISRKTLRTFWEHHPGTEQPLCAWYRRAARADWQTPEDIKRAYRSASFLAANRVVFNVKGNRFRLVVAVNYGYGILYIRFVGTHQEYDRIDASTV